MSTRQDPVALPPNRMYRALVERDESFRGAFFVGVTSTGVFCRPGCPARTPLRRHCEFFPGAPQALQAGYRPCLRCKPLSPGATEPRWAARVVERLSRNPECVLTAADIRAAGADPAAASRYFKAHFGASTQALSRARRVGVALRWIREGKPLSGSMRGAGFASESGFRKAVKDLFGLAPGEAARAGATPLVAAWIESPLGPILAAAGDRGICLLEFIDRRALAAQLATLRRRLRRPIVPGTNAHLDHLKRELAAYFRDPSTAFSVPIESPGTEFQRQVWDRLRQIPRGQTRSYADIAREVGRPSAVRAVARANGDNRLALIIPCHRVIGSDGALTGYGGGVWRKQWLLEHERATISPRSGRRAALQEALL